MDFEGDKDPAVVSTATGTDNNVLLQDGHHNQQIDANVDSQLDLTSGSGATRRDIPAEVNPMKAIVQKTQE